MTKRDVKHIVVGGGVGLIAFLSFWFVKNRKPLFAVECKTGDRDLSPAIRYFAERTAIPRFYQVHLGQRHFEQGKTTMLPFHVFCRDLALP